MADRKNDLERTHIINILIDHLTKNSFAEIRADLSGYNPPQKLSWKNGKQGHAPDVSAIYGKKLFLFEVETFDSIVDGLAKDRWRVLSAYAQERNCIFVVIVPKGCQKKAKKRARSYNIRNEVWTIS